MYSIVYISLKQNKWNLTFYINECMFNKVSTNLLNIWYSTVNKVPNYNGCNWVLVNTTDM